MKTIDRSTTMCHQALVMLALLSAISMLGLRASHAEPIVLEHPLRVQFKPATKEAREFISARKNIGAHSVFRTIRACDERRVQFTDGMVIPWSYIDHSARIKSVYTIVNQLYTQSRSPKMLDVGEAALGSLPDKVGLADQAKFRLFKEQELKRLKALPTPLHQHRIERPVRLAALFQTIEARERGLKLSPQQNGFLLSYDERGYEAMGRNGFTWRMDWTDITPGSIVTSIFDPLLFYEGDIEKWQFVDRILASLPPNPIKEREENRKLARVQVAERITMIKEGRVPKKPSPAINPKDELKIVTVLEKRGASRKASRDVAAWPEHLQAKQKGVNVILSDINQLSAISAIASGNRDDVDVVLFSIGGWGEQSPVVSLATRDKHSWARLVESVATRIGYAKMCWPEARVVLVMPPRVYPKKADPRKNKNYWEWLQEVPQWHEWLADQYGQLAKEKDALFINGYNSVDEANFADRRGFPWFSFNDTGHAQYAEAIWKGLSDK